MKHKTYLEELASFVANLKFSDIPKEVISKANDAWFDLMGCYLAGLNDENSIKLINHYLSSNNLGKITLWGTGSQLSLDATVLIEGYIGYSLEFDDGVSLAGHFGSSSIPTALACTEFSNGNGKDFLTSIICAYEVGTRLSRRFAPYMLEHKIHFPCAMGAFAAAGAASKAFKLNEETIAAGLANGCLAPVGPYGTATSGKPIKNMYSGWPNFVGLKMIEFAQLGLGGDIDSFESDNGLAVAYKGAALTYEEEKEALKDLGKHYSLMESYFKPFPCCRWLHAPLDLLQKISTNNPKRKIKNVFVQGPKFLKLYDTKGDFSQKVKAQYSIPFVLSAFICYGKLGIEEFELEKRTSKKLREFAELIKIEIDPLKEKQFPEHFSVSIKVLFEDGGEECLDGGLPWSPDSPATKQELIDKFVKLVSPIMNREEIEKWLQLYKDGLEKEGNFKKLLYLLSKNYLKEKKI